MQSSQFTDGIFTLSSRWLQLKSLVVIALKPNLYKGTEKHVRDYSDIDAQIADAALSMSTSVVAMPPEQPSKKSPLRKKHHFFLSHHS